MFPVSLFPVSYPSRSKKEGPRARPINFRGVVGYFRRFEFVIFFTFAMGIICYSRLNGLYRGQRKTDFWKNGFLSRERASVFPKIVGCVKKKAPRPFVLESARPGHPKAFTFDILRNIFLLFSRAELRRRRRASPYIDVPL